MPNLRGTSWGATPVVLGDAGGVVTWSIAQGGEDLSAFSGVSGVSVAPNSFLTFDYERIITRAFDDWSAAGNIEFIQVDDPGGAAGAVLDPDIRIFSARSLGLLA